MRIPTGARPSTEERKLRSHHARRTVGAGCKGRASQRKQGQGMGQECRASDRLVPHACASGFVRFNVVLHDIFRQCR
eukprot:scaffold3966_cov126-Isochrysis_galbana.AAC.3